MTAPQEPRASQAGTMLVGTIATRYPDSLPRDVLRGVLRQQGGNLSRTARTLTSDGFKASLPTLRAAIEALGLWPWLVETYPARERGGAPLSADREATASAVRRALDEKRVDGRDADVLRRRFVEHHTLEAIAVDLGKSRQLIRKIEQRALRRIGEQRGGNHV